MILEKLAGPLIGAVIGYCTNYIAVKMLFYPKKKSKSGDTNFRLPREQYQKENRDWQKQLEILWQIRFSQRKI